jgi:AraC family transcriptional regulator
MKYIFGTWLPNADVDYAGTGDFELYDSRFNPNGPSGELDIYVPVTPR